MDVILISLAGFLGGLLNAVAGGGSFFTLSALIFVGVPPIIANATGTAALLPGYITSAWRFRHDIKWPEGVSFLLLSVVALLGGCLGAVILLLTDASVFSKLIPLLILFATLAFIVGPILIKKRAGSDKNTDSKSPINKVQFYINLFILFLVCVYGGYFNGGLGIILLAALSLMGLGNLHSINGLKNVISALLTTIAVVVYWQGDSIDTHYLLLLSVMAVLGGYVGAALSYRISQHYLRIFIIVVGLLLSVKFYI